MYTCFQNKNFQRIVTIVEIDWIVPRICSTYNDTNIRYNQCYLSIHFLKRNNCFNTQLRENFHLSLKAVITNNVCRKMVEAPRTLWFLWSYFVEYAFFIYFLFNEALYHAYQYIASGRVTLAPHHLMLIMLLVTSVYIIFMII